MILEIIAIDNGSKGKGSRKIRFFRLECDCCGVIFQRPYSKRDFTRHHYHSKECITKSKQRNGLIYQSQQATFYKLYNVKHHFQTQESKNKNKKTMLERYGVENPTQMEINKNKSHTVEAELKRHKTMKSNGTYAKHSSVPEELVFKFLCDNFDVNNIERWKVMNFKWPIDFFIKNINVYVQLDGAYWHGLDRSIEEISLLKTKRDKNILRKIQIDNEQNQWFKQNEYNLVRITDVEFANDNNSILSKIKIQLHEHDILGHMKDAK